MALTVCTWNINSVRLREPIVLKLLQEEAPDILCLQETKCPVDKFPYDAFRALGYQHVIVRGQKGYNGVSILSRVPVEDAGSHDFCEKGDARHVAVRTGSGLTIHNFYVPAGGDIPDVALNEKFAHKLNFLREMQEWFRAEPPRNAVLVGDLNIAPREDDVWNHRQLLKVVSHTPVEVEQLTLTQGAGAWVDITRRDIPEGPLFSWWSYRSPDWNAADKGRRLDHIWATPDVVDRSGGSRIARHVRGWEKPSDHAPVFAEFDV